MAKLTKNRKESISKFDRDMLYSLEEASKIVKDFPKLKFDSSVDIAVNLGVDPKKADQNILKRVMFFIRHGGNILIYFLEKDF